MTKWFLLEQMQNESEKNPLQPMESVFLKLSRNKQIANQSEELVFMKFSTTK